MIETARVLTEADPTKPRRANLRRAVSTAYYALFHCLARSCADLFIGKSGPLGGAPAWHQAYRALEHGAVVNACKNKTVMEKFPQGIQDFADAFIDMQDKRHSADYSLTASFSKSETIEDIDKAEAVIKKYNSAKIETRRAFAALVLFKARRG